MPVTSAPLGVTWHWNRTLASRGVLVSLGSPRAPRMKIPPRNDKIKSEVQCSASSITTYKTAMHRLGHPRIVSNCQIARSTYIAPGVPGPWLSLRQISVDTEYHRAKEHKLSHATHGLDKGFAACTPFPSRVNTRDVGRGKL